jgi:hypothetical protein
VRLLAAALGVLLVTLQLVDGLLEESVCVLIVLLVLLLLLLEELELALPEGALLIELGLQVGVQAISLVVLDLPLLGVLAGTGLALGHGLLELFVLLRKLGVLLLKILDQLFLAALEVLVLLAGDGGFALVLRMRLLDGLFEGLEGFALLLVLLVDVLLLLLHSADALLHCLGRVVLLLLETLLVTFDRLPLLLVVLVDALLLEGDLLVLEGTVTLEVDLLLRQVVNGLLRLVA